MTIVLEGAPVSAQPTQTAYIQWGPAIAGALAAAALSFVLDSFAAAIGLAASSTSPTWRDSSATLMLLTGLYLILVAIVAFGVGGYLAGRLRPPLDTTADEVDLRDGTYGLVVWAIAMVLTALFAWAASQSISQVGSSSNGTRQSQSVAGENLIAFDLDRLFRSERRPQGTDLGYARAEAARILLTSTGHTGVKAEDRSYLIRLTANTTGLSQAQAEQRTDAVIGQARDDLRKARRSGVILAFMAGAAALIGAAVAWFAACAGGEHRDGRSVPSHMLGLRRRAEI